MTPARLAALAALLVGCPAPQTPTPTPLPEPDDLPAHAEPPDVLTPLDGAGPVNAAGWQVARRPELLRLFAHYVYGFAPEPVAVAVTATETGDGVFSVEVALQGGPTLHVALFVPDGPGPFPVLLGLNKCGNRTVSDAAGVPDGGGWLEAGCDPTPGSRAGYWSIDDARAAGVAVATVHQSDIAPDDADDPVQGVRAAYDPGVEARGAWGTIAAWSWGLRHVAEGLRQVAQVDADRIAVFGHSRRGKAALWAAAQDPTLVAAFPHQSGIAGAALSRDSTGETVRAINALFPHWFAPRFADFADAEDRLPLDQHALLALVAPRPLRVTDGEDDAWAFPAGAAEAVLLATPVFALLGAPAPDQVLRPGGHDVRPEDWAAWLERLSD